MNGPQDVPHVFLCVRVSCGHKMCHTHKDVPQTYLWHCQAHPSLPTPTHPPTTPTSKTPHTHHRGGSVHGHELVTNENHAAICSRCPFNHLQKKRINKKNFYKTQTPAQTLENTDRHNTQTHSYKKTDAQIQTWKQANIFFHFFFTSVTRVIPPSLAIPSPTPHRSDPTPSHVCEKKKGVIAPVSR